MSGQVWPLHRVQEGEVWAQHSLPPIPTKKKKSSFAFYL